MKTIRKSYFLHFAQNLLQVRVKRPLPEKNKPCAAWRRNFPKVRRLCSATARRGLRSATARRRAGPSRRREHRVAPPPPPPARGRRGRPQRFSSPSISQTQTLCRVLARKQLAQLQTSDNLPRGPGPQALGQRRIPRRMPGPAWNAQPAKF